MMGMCEANKTQPQGNYSPMGLSQEAPNMVLSAEKSRLVGLKKKKINRKVEVSCSEH